MLVANEKPRRDFIVQLSFFFCHFSQLNKWAEKGKSLFCLYRLTCDVFPHNKDACGQKLERVAVDHVIAQTKMAQLLQIEVFTVLEHRKIHQVIQFVAVLISKQPDQGESTCFVLYMSRDSFSDQFKGTLRNLRTASKSLHKLQEIFFIELLALKLEFEAIEYEGPCLALVRIKRKQIRCLAELGHRELVVALLEKVF